ncbi:PKD domain-containing protein [Nocardioides sp. GY 10127]|nr:PKD domain-containing protein [Nocardioides sp. GY 10127]
MTTWVLGWLVHDYDGGGGIDDAVAATPGAPVAGTVVDADDVTLSWTQSQGVTQDWQWQVLDNDEEVVAEGTTDGWTDLDAYRAAQDSADPTDDSPTWTADVTGLDPGTRYHWTVTGTDVFGNTVPVSSTKYFRTDGPPVVSLDTDDTVVDAGTEVTLHNTSTDSLGATTYDWSFGDGTTLLDQPNGDVTHTWDTAGDYTVRLTGTSEKGSATARTRVSVVPVTEDDTYEGTEDTLLHPARSVLANDTGATSAAVYSSPAHGTLTLDGDGTFRYRPDADWCGTDTFRYRADDARNARVTLEVACVDDAPVTKADTYRVRASATVRRVASPGVLRNDDEVDGQAMTARLVRRPSVGSVTLRSNGGLVIRVPAGRTGRRTSFTYRACDDGGTCSATTKVVLRLR